MPRAERSVDLGGRLLLIPVKPDDERDRVAQAWNEAGGDVLRLDRFWQPPALGGRSVAIYGPHTFALVLAQVLDLDLVGPPHDSMIKLSDQLLSRAVGLSSRLAAGDITYPVFAKPVSPKLFPARVYGSREDLLLETDGLEDDLDIFWSEIVDFVAEVRCFCLDGVVRAAAQYEGEGGDPSAEACSVAERALSDASITGPVVVDVGLTARGGWAVIEFNDAWGAGLNGCDAPACLPVLKEATRRRVELPR